MIPCPGKAGIRLGCTSVDTPETEALLGHGMTLEAPHPKINDRLRRLDIRICMEVADAAI